MTIMMKHAKNVKKVTNITMWY